MTDSSLSSTASHEAAHDLLIELFTEELPPKALKALGESFSQSVVSELVTLGLSANSARYEGFATPRRLAVRVAQVQVRGADRSVEVKGPSSKVGLDAEGKATMALSKWAEKQGARVDQLSLRSDGKQDCFYFQSTVPGANLADEISRIIQVALAKLPVPKVMQYQLADGVTNVSFVRPAHRLLVLHGKEVLAAEVLGLKSDRLTEGHRFMTPASADAQGTSSVLSIASPDRYDAVLLEQGRVIASYATRRQKIAQALLEAARAQGANLTPDSARISDEAALNGELAGYLDEVTALVEWPRVYTAGFEARYLAVPQECLILTMRTNQKYFPLFDAQGKLLPKFLLVSNMDVADPKNIIEGNERVVRPRLSDAEFFFTQDQKQSLEARVPQLANVVYHAKLGTQLERMQRVSCLAEKIAQEMGADPQPAVRAATLAKADLLSGMVGEFPELQGIMGRYYALHDGESAEVAQAVAQHYQPRFAGDALPAYPYGCALALADKLETLSGIWGIGQQPTGDKDPFALRRHALGVTRMLIETVRSTATPSSDAAAFTGLAFSLTEILQWSFDGLAGLASVKVDVAGLRAFVLDRVRSYFKDKGFAPAHIEACLSAENPNSPTAFRLDSLTQRLAAVQSFASLPEAQALAAANKRIGNILKKNDVHHHPALSSQVDPGQLIEPAEQALFAAISSTAPVAQAHYAAGDFERSLSSLAALRAPVDQFFEQVMVMAEDPAVRTNRLHMLSQLHATMNRVADLAFLS
jgi:glycyl-tRNA synthetase beta chain